MYICLNNDVYYKTSRVILYRIIILGFCSYYYCIKFETKIRPCKKNDMCTADCVHFLNYS